MKGKWYKDVFLSEFYNKLLWNVIAFIILLGTVFIIMLVIVISFFDVPFEYKEIYIFLFVLVLIPTIFGYLAFVIYYYWKVKPAKKEKELFK